MPLLDPDVPRPKHLPTAAEVALAQRTIADVQRTLASPMMRDAAESIAAMGKEASETLAKVSGLSSLDLMFAMRGVTDAANQVAEIERQRNLVFERMGADLARALQPPKQLEYRLPPPPATSDDIRRLERRIAGLETVIEAIAQGDPEERQRIAETHLRTEQMHRHFVPEEPGDPQP